jgi:EAL domain-containing protein (putative c-di-GMP-specific phosphodiesterase class I)
VLKWLEQSIGASSYATVCCSNPTEALKHILEGDVLAVVSDVSMPGMSGTELLRILHEHDPDLPVVLVTGVPRVESAIEAVEHGAFMYLVKPVEPSLLAITVERAVLQYFGARQKRQTLSSLGIEDETSSLIQLQTRFDEALAQMWMDYQPVVQVPSHSVLGYEALLRSGDSVLHEPDLLLHAADRLGKLPALGRAIRARSAEPFLGADLEHLLFINLYPQDLRDPELWHEGSTLGTIASRVVFEFTERTSVGSIDEIRSKLAELRARGYRIAIDDAGAGYASLNCIASLEPDFVKLDMTLVRDLSRDALKQKLVSTLIALSHEMGHAVIAEGVERRDESEALSDLGCGLQQGYFFARPRTELVQTIAPPN